MDLATHRLSPLIYALAVVLDALVVRSRRLDAQTATASPLEPFPRLCRVAQEVLLVSLRLLLQHFGLVFLVCLDFPTVLFVDASMVLRALRVLYYLALLHGLALHCYLLALSDPSLMDPLC